MSAIDQAKKFYLEYCYRKTFLRDDQKIQLKNNIQHYMVAANREAPLKDLFQNSWMFDILNTTLKQKAAEKRDLMSIERAFKSLEKYFLLIVQQPWKTEFREIKMYGGFYRTRIKAVIHDCEHIFERAGYMISPDKSIMMYRGQMDKNFLFILAFDCRFSQIQCKAIAEHYDQMRSFSVNLRDIISYIFYDEDSLEPSQHHQTENITLHSNVTAPPALPKREPITSGAVPRANLKPDHEFHTSKDDKHLIDHKLNTRIALHPRKSYLPFDPTLYTVPKSQLLSGAISEPLSYMENDTVEIIPELPEGTSEDHMRESLRLVKQQNIPPRAQLEYDWKWVSSRHIPAMNVSHMSTANLYSGDIMQNSKPEHSRDEGIDMSTSKSFSINSKCSSYGNQQILPNKHTNPHQASFDPGNPESIYSQSSVLSLQHLNQPIYLPPNIATDGTNPVLHRKMSLSRQNALQPHLPPRALMPSQNTEKDSLFSQRYFSALTSSPSQYPMMLQTQTSSETRIAQPTLSAPGYLTLPGTPEMEDVLRPERPTVYKSNSLKVSGKGSPLSEQIATARMARSMDMTFWECPSCYKLNSSPNIMCSVCSQAYTGTDVTPSDYNKTEAMF